MCTKIINGVVCTRVRHYFMLETLLLYKVLTCLNFSTSKLVNFPPQKNGIGDACDCEANFDCDQDLDAEDLTEFLLHFGRGGYSESMR